ncbi:circadian clock protein KaiC [Archaeoglobales archaeon]|nr:MAG: circadian clock protein KaiC [Archaeoglobales archaeon]
MVIVMRISTGIYGLDELLGGGYLKNTVNIILGSTGTGKTVFALQYLLKGLEDGEKAIYVSFDMDVEDVIQVATSLGWFEIEDYINNNMLLINKFFAENVTYLNDNLINFIVENSDGNTRIVIDSFTPLIASLSYEMRNDVNWFFAKLKEYGTALISLEEPLNGDLSDPSIVIPLFLGDSVIQLKSLGYGEAFNRTLRIVKHRRSWHAEGVFPYRILDGIGIYVEGASYVEESRKKIDLDAVFDELGVSKSSIPEKILRRLEVLAKNSDEEAERIIIEIVKRYR